MKEAAKTDREAAKLVDREKKAGLQKSHKSKATEQEATKALKKVTTSDREAAKLMEKERPEEVT